MKNKTFTLLVVLALLALPAVASAQTEFTLGGYIKLHAFWDSAAVNKNLTTAPLRNNDREGHHGRFNATSQSSRFNFTIKGPDLWGAKTSGMIEMDFDNDTDARKSSSNAYVPRLRLAFFRFNWPGTELLMGQYWGLFSTFAPETIQDAGFQFHGFPATDRFAQVRVTQTFGLGWAKDDKVSLAALVGKAIDSADAAAGFAYPPTQTTPPTGTTTLSGQTSETPQFQAAVTYEGDLWGKAAFYGAPRGFTAQVVGGWQRSRYQQARLDILAGTVDQRYLDNWCVQGSLFIPIIPTATKNLAGTMAFSATGYVGQGLEFIGNQNVNNSFVSVVGNVGPVFTAFEQQLMRVVGASMNLNYYFSNQWFLTANAGWALNYGVNGTDARVVGLVHNWWETDLTLYYWPIKAFKFGLGYAYSRAEYYRNAAPNVAGTMVLNDRGTNFGEGHRVQFGSWFYF